MEYTIELKSFRLSDINDKLKTDWDDIALRLDANPSLYPDWTNITAESHEFGSAVEILVLQRGHEVVGVFPIYSSLSRFFGLRFRSLGLVSNCVSYHNSLLSLVDPERTVRLIVDAASQRNADVIHFAGIPDETQWGAYLGGHLRSSDYRVITLPGESSPYLPLTESWGDLLASKPKKFRYKLRKRAESLANSSNLRMQWFENIDNYSELINAIGVVEENSWKKEAGVSIFDNDHELRYHESLLPYLFSKGAAFANVLFHEELPIAYNLCCIWNGWVGQMKTSFDTRFSDLSPGALVIDSAIQHAFKLGASEFDFLGGKDQHKLTWTKSVRAHSDHFLYLRSSVKGTLIGLLKSMRERLSHPKR